MKIKTLTAVLTSVLICCLSIIPVSAAEFKHASVSGIGRIQADADTATISFSVEGSGSDIKNAEKAVNDSVSKIEKVFSKDGKIKHEGFFSYTGENGNTYATKNLVLITEKPNSSKTITEKLIANGASSVCPPMYDVKDRSEWESKALKEAYDNAISRAKALGINSEPTSLRDLGSTPYCCYDFIPTSNGKVCIECKIILVFN